MEGIMNESASFINHMESMRDHYKSVRYPAKKQPEALSQTCNADLDLDYIEYKSEYKNEYENEHENKFKKTNQNSIYNFFSNTNANKRASISASVSTNANNDERTSISNDEKNTEDKGINNENSAETKPNDSSDQQSPPAQTEIITVKLFKQDDIVSLVSNKSFLPQKPKKMTEKVTEKITAILANLFK